jgi:hypothetical protein
VSSRHDLSTNDTQPTSSPVTTVTERSITVPLPNGRYYMLRVKLKSERVMAVVIPYDVSREEASEIHEELSGIVDIVSKWRT